MYENIPNNIPLFHDSPDVWNTYIMQPGPKDYVGILNPFIKETKIRDSRISFVDSIEQAYGKVELAHVCTPNSTHYGVVKELLSNGISR